MKIKYIAILILFFTTKSFSDSCVGTPTSCSFFPFSTNQCQSQIGCSSSFFTGQCSGTATSCSSVPIALCNSQNGCVRVLDGGGTPTTPPPSDLERLELLLEILGPENFSQNFAFNRYVTEPKGNIRNPLFAMPGEGFVELPLYTLNQVSEFMLNDNFTAPNFGSQPLSEVWYSHNFDKHGNGRQVFWELPHNWELEIRYHIVSADEIIGEEELNLSSSNTYESGINDAYLWAIPPRISNLFYNSRVNLPENNFSSTRDEYLAVIYSFRATNTVPLSAEFVETPPGAESFYNGTHYYEVTRERSDWIYTKPIWVYSPD